METELLLSEEQTRGKVRHSRGRRSFLSWLCCPAIARPPASCSPWDSSLSRDGVQGGTHCLTGGCQCQNSNFETMKEAQSKRLSCIMTINHHRAKVESLLGRKL